MTNLLTETLEAITESGHTPDQVTFIGSQDAEYRCTFAEFATIANAEYHSGFGATEVATDLIIMFTDGRRMWRGRIGCGSIRCRLWSRWWGGSSCSRRRICG